MVGDDVRGHDRARVAAPDRLGCATPDVSPVLMACALIGLALAAGLAALVAMYA